MSQAHTSHLWPGVPLALASAVLFGLSAPLAKLLLGTVAPQLLAGLLYLGAGIGLAIVHLGRAAPGIPAPEAPLRPADLPWLAAVVLFGGVMGPLLLMLGLNQTSASSGSLLLNLEGLATMGIAWLVFHENVDRLLLLGALAIVAGAVALSWDGHAVRFDAGAALIAAACVTWGIDNNITRKLSSADPVLTTMIKGLVAGGVNVGLAVLNGSMLPSIATMGEAALVLLRRRCEPGALRAGLAAPWHGADRRLFLAGALHRRGCRARFARRIPDVSIAIGGSADGLRALAAPCRAA